MTPAVHRLRLSSAVAQALRRHHLGPDKRVESVSMAMGHAHAGPDGALTVQLANPADLRFFAADCYSVQGPYAVVLDAQVAASVHHEAVQKGFNAVLVIHDHNFANQARFSAADDQGDRLDARNHVLGVAPQVDGLWVAVSVVIAQQQWAARVLHGAGPQQVFEPMHVDSVGPALERLSSAGRRSWPEQALRHQGVISAATQALLGELHVAVAGVGGLGSVLAEALGRSGVGRVSLIDHDSVEASNLNRLQGVGPCDVGRPKVEVVAAHLSRVCPHTRFDAFPTTVFEPEARAAMAAADVLMGGVDNNATRWWLNRLALQYMLPWFDAGVLIEPKPARVMHTRHTALVPGFTPCGQCSPIEFFERQRPPQFMDARTLSAMRSAGYVAGQDRLADATPSVYALNLQAASWAVQNLLDWLDGQAPVHSIYHRSDKALIERLPMDHFGGQLAGDCPLCQTLLGRAGSVHLPGHEPERAPWGTDTFEDIEPGC
jgi:hypothetical protein